MIDKNTIFLLMTRGTLLARDQLLQTTLTIMLEQF